MSRYASINLVVVRQRLSPDRLARYEAASGNLARAMRLYEWNIESSAAFYKVLHGVEVVLRNALDQQMTRHHLSLGLPGTWFDDPSGVLGPRLQDRISEAHQRILAQRARRDAESIGV